MISHGDMVIVRVENGTEMMLRAASDGCVCRLYMGGDAPVALLNAYEVSKLVRLGQLELTIAAND